MRRVLGLLTGADLLVLGAITLLTALTVAAAPAIPLWPRIAALDAVAFAAVVAIAAARGRARAGWVACVHDWYVAPAIFLVYKHVDVVLRVYRPVDRDAWLVAADRFLFGTDASVALRPFAHPAVVELLQVAYTSFYLLFLVVGHEIYRRRPRATYRFYAFACVYGFFVTYLAYAAVPAVGPRFTLHSFSALAHELPGLWFTPALRAFVNAGGSIPAGVPDAVAAAAAQRDVFPSGHTAMTCALVAWAWSFRLRVAPAITAIGVLVVAGALYLRYHYAVDLLAGGLFGGFIVATAPGVYRAVLRWCSPRDSFELARPAAGQTTC